jgi:predicted dithiol-disulfide oxidoreductase (DUF899 family)
MTAVETKSKVVSPDAWRKARIALLAEEKELTRRRDELARKRRDLPWERVGKDYVFEGPNGAESLASLFQGRSQLVIYHFMLGDNWAEGCKSCSYLADHFDGANMHLPHRDVTFAAVSQAPMPQIQTFQKRMGWQFHWVSANANSFQTDYGVHFTQEELAGEVVYNYGKQRFGATEAPGISVFYKDEAGEIFHTYSAYARGLDALVGAYQFLDLTPKGRDEDGLAFSMSWVQHHDRYESAPKIDPAAGYEPPRLVTSCCSEEKAAS